MAMGNVDFFLAASDNRLECDIRLDVFSMEEHLDRDETRMSRPRNPVDGHGFPHPSSFTLVSAVTFPHKGGGGFGPSPFPPRRAIISAGRTLGEGTIRIRRLRMFALSVDELVAPEVGVPFS
jgi:hypothetical protein